MTYTDADHADRMIRTACQYPFDTKDDGRKRRKGDWAMVGARAVLNDLQDRRGIKTGFGGIDEDVRAEIVKTLAQIIRRAHEIAAPSTGD